MSNVLSCWFWKKKNKEDKYQFPYSKQQKQIVLNSIIYSEPHFRNAYDTMAQQNHQPYRRRTSESLSQDSSNRSGIVNINKNRKIRSYPVSPVRRFHEDKGYLSDKQRRVEVRGDTPYVEGPKMVYVTNMPHNSTLFRTEPRHEQQEPFPYEIQQDIVPRRSSMFYGVQQPSENTLDSNDSPRYAAEKPIEDFERPGTSYDENFNLLPKKEQKKHVTIVAPNDPIEGSLYVDEDNLKTDHIKKATVVRFRPQSSGSFIPGEHVKLMTVRANQVQHPPLVPGKFVHPIPMRPSKIPPVLITSDGKKLVAVDENKVRNSLKLDKESQLQRLSVNRTSTAADNVNDFPIHPEEQVFCAVPIKQARQSIVHPRRSSILQPKRSSIPKRDSFEMKENDPFPLNQNSQVPMVYAVPMVPTRGRTRSILQQSVKSLTSKNTDQLSIPKKNIRYSNDTDVFTASSRQRSTVHRSSQYVNMEKGHTMLVSDVLNPITSLFISDLKDTVPKDPQTKPKESNTWVAPRKQSPQQYTKKTSINRPSQRVRVVYRETQSKVASPVQRRRSRSYDKHRRRRDDSSSSDESFEVYKKKSKQLTNKGAYHQQVYAAQMPDITLPEPSTTRILSTGKNPTFKKKGKTVVIDRRASKSDDLCALDCESPGGAETSKHITAATNVNTVSSGQQTDVDEDDDDDLDLICYPSEKFIKNTALATESGSKLRWRIIIKRGEEK